MDDDVPFYYGLHLLADAIEKYDELCPNNTLPSSSYATTGNNILKGQPMITPPENLMAKIEGMGGSNVMLVIRKTIQKTDLKSNNNRLSIPVGQLANEDFLSAEEKDSIQCNNINNVSLVDPLLNVIEGLGLRRWNMGASFIYVLYNWRSVVDENELQPGEVIQLWSFRLARDLHFALVREEDHPVMGEEESAA